VTRYRFFTNGSEPSVWNAITATNHSSVPSRMCSSMISPYEAQGDARQSKDHPEGGRKFGTSTRECHPPDSACAGEGGSILPTRLQSATQPAPREKPLPKNRRQPEGART
jgi:hypothetical protein